MSEFQIYSVIPEKSREEIKIFHVFNDWENQKNVLYVTTSDSVFCIGDNKSGVCGLGHNLPVNEPTQLVELCGKNLQNFITGQKFVFALTLDRRMYAWGYNYFGQLAAEHNGQDYWRSIEIDFFRNKVIDQVSCGFSHALTLTSDGHVFGWGGNYSGQVGCGKSLGPKVFDVQELKEFQSSKVASIHCSKNLSFAVTRDGMAFGWGENSQEKLGHETRENFYKPKLIGQVTNVKCVCSSSENTYVLTNDGKIMVFGQVDNMSHFIIREVIPTSVDRFVNIYDNIPY